MSPRPCLQGLDIIIVCRVDLKKKMDIIIKWRFGNGLEGRGRVCFAGCRHLGCRFFYPRYVFRAAWASCWVRFLSSGWKLTLYVRLAGCDFCRGESGVMAAWPSLRTHLTAKGARGWDLP